MFNNKNKEILMNNIEKYYCLLLPIVGILCLIMPGVIAKWLPTILGSIMVLTSITDTILVIKEKLPYH